MKRILLLSDDIILNRVFISAAKSFEFQVQAGTDFNESLEYIKKDFFDCIIVSIPLITEKCPKKIITDILNTSPYIRVYFLTDQMDYSQVITLTKAGAEYCYTKPFSFEEILEHIQNATKNISVLQLPIQGNKTDDYPKYLNATSRHAKELYKQIDTVADTNFKVIIHGETGTGKESVARRLCSGIYKNKPFISVDCGCLNKELAASELFGHVKGSFSGAYADKKGAFEEANGGTIFLDEIANLDYPVQILLLRAIEEKKIKKVGSVQEIDIDVRIIVASNEKLSDAVAEGRFREDLYYRLNEFEITTPPLRERMDDLQDFIDFFIGEANIDLNKSINGVDKDLLELFYNYDWPGNIRELKNIIRRGCLMATKMIDLSCMADDFSKKLSEVKICHPVMEKNVEIERVHLDWKHKSMLSEYHEILNVLKSVRYNKTKAAEVLNINRKTLYNKLKMFSIFDHLTIA
ncbi:sigma-54-dependent transcriptional regulator [Polluticaenibacter yanchengensis]|uniref:Sigma-54 dependent transcriptional regulator n=1 Tax=Polluticaenibacter yanchengensis TaxID=3014562 RepID=A0ABT4UJS8_9BACT|nr:sigma-54 dependent transcriptional regulator [Chitinophagaceae bacterium LY-5]